MTAQFELPRKLREIMNHHMDSTVWNDFQFRDDDIVIATWGKSGTTWLQQIVGQMIFGGSDEINITEISMGRSARPAQTRKTGDAGSADPPQISQDPSGRRCPGILSQGQIYLYWARRPRRAMEYV